LAAWTVTLRGIGHRPGRSLVVLLLAAAATAATVLAPGYARAAQESVLVDGLASAPADATSLTVRAEAGPGQAPPVASIDEAKVEVGQALLRRPTLAAHLDHPIGSADVETTVTAVNGAHQALAARFAYRDSVCRRLTMVVGECKVDSGFAVVSQRSAAQYKITVGSSLTVKGRNVVGSQPRNERTIEVSGLYSPKDPGDPYWGRGGYFAAGLPDDEAALPRIDAVFAGDEQDLTLPGAPPSISLEYRLKPGTISLDEVPGLNADLSAFETEMNGASLSSLSALRDVLRDIGAQTVELSRSVPVIAVPLVLLSWFILFLLVAALTEDRASEVALAKLRGYPLGRAARFGRSETLVLIMLAVPLGALAGLGLVELAARTMLGPGVHAESRWPIWVAAGVALLASLLASRFAGRRTLAKGVLDLLRRTPERARWTTGALEAGAIALAGASLFAALSDQTAPLALLAAPLVAVVAGIVAGRLLGLWSRIRVHRYARRGRVPALLAHAQLSRRPLARRMVVVVTVAVALLSFATMAWDVAAQARVAAAQDTVGADRVVGVEAPDPAALKAAVAAADPGGHSMAVVRVSEHYNTGSVEVIAVDSKRLADVAVWRGRSAAAVADLAARLRPATLPAALPVVLAGPTPADDPTAASFTFPGLGEGAQKFAVVDREDALPRVGEHAVLMDLDNAVASAQASSSLSDNTRLHYEVWANEQAPTDLARRLGAAGLQILREQSIHGYLAQLARGAPALGLRLYLLAGAAAVALVVGAVLLTAYVGAPTRRYELAALRVTGVRRSVLVRGILREYAHLLGVPLLVGFAAGLAGARLMIPGLALVKVGTAVGPVHYQLGSGALPVAGGAVVAALTLAVLAVLFTARRATPDRLREAA
jgi:putative ABC transport system permease protein